MIIFKILREAEFAFLEKNKTSFGSQDDEKDGFIHFSTEEQLERTNHVLS